MITAGEFSARWSGHTPGLLGARRRCAVLCPLVERRSGLSFLFEVRAAALKSQGGETCFPGGRAEQGESAEACALRETQEELAIAPSHIRVLGQSDFLCTQSGFLVQPVIGLVDEEGFERMAPAPAEVAETFLTPVSFFLDTPPELYSYALEPVVSADFPYAAVGVERDYPWARGKVEVPVWHWGEHAIWGMTARIVRDLVTHLH